MRTFALFLLLVGGAGAFLPASMNTKVVSPAVRSSTALGPYSNLTPEQLEVQLDQLRNSYGEVSRRYRRSFFTHDEWLKHRAVDRFPGTLLKLAQSGVVRDLAGEVAFITLTAAFVVIWNCLFVVGFDDLTGMHYDPMAITGLSLPLLAMPSTPFTFSSPALALLLGKCC